MRGRSSKILRKEQYRKCGHGEKGWEKKRCLPDKGFEGNGELVRNTQIPGNEGGRKVGRRRNYAGKGNR